MSTRRCGRLGRHDAHDWISRCLAHPVRSYRCNGHVVTEGGAS